VTLQILKLERALMKVRRQLIDAAGLSGQTYFHHRVAEYREMWRAVARTAGATFTELAADLWEVELDSVKTRIHNHEMEFDNPVVLGLAGSKTVVHRLLTADGLVVPEYAVFNLTELDVAERFLLAHPGGCVVKPANGYGGQGVTTHVQRTKELRRAAIRASLYGGELMIEAQVPGESYRLLVLEGRMIHAVCRRGPRLNGDGRSTVRQLIDAENRWRRREGKPALDIDRDCLFTLDYQRLSLGATPEPLREFLVKSVNDPARKYADVRTVYTDVVTDVIAPSVRRDAERAAHLVGSEFLGVDIITPDPTVPLRQSGGVINEVNTTPALHHHYESSNEPFPGVAMLALQALVRKKLGTLAAAQR
jgi:D-alanine-D-alanine ligase-like ATP-grasp enzyme